MLWYSGELSVYDSEHIKIEEGGNDLGHYEEVSKWITKKETTFTRY